MALDGLEPSTRASYAAAWDRVCVVLGASCPMCAPFERVLLAVETCCASESISRPEAWLSRLQAATAVVAAASGRESPFGHLLWPKLRRKIIKLHTTSDARRPPQLDVVKLLHFLRSKHGRFCVPAEWVAAGVAATLPGRRAEWIALELDDAVVVLADPRVGHAHQRMPIVTLAERIVHEYGGELSGSDPLPPILAGVSWRVVLHVSRSKADKVKRAGFDKLLFHHADAPWSPAYLLLCHVVARVRAAPFARRALVMQQQGSGVPLFAGHGFALQEQPLEPNALTAKFAAVSRAATQVECTPRAFRPAAAAFLLSVGLDIDSVCAMGGWHDDTSLRRHYARLGQISRARQLALAGVLSIDQL